MPRFSVRAALMSMALIAIGLAAFLSEPRGPIKMLSFPLLGAGICTPFGRPWLGAIVGILVPVGLFLLVIVSWTIFGNPD